MPLGLVGGRMFEGKYEGTGVLVPNGRGCGHPWSMERDIMGRSVRHGTAPTEAMRRFEEFELRRDPYAIAMWIHEVHEYEKERA